MENSPSTKCAKLTSYKEDQAKVKTEIGENFSGVSMHALEELVTCAVCQKRFRSPKMLQCQHTFCFACLQTNLNHQEEKSYIICFTCGGKQDLDTTSGKLSTLPSNLYIVSMLRLLDRQIAAVQRNQKPCSSTSSLANMNDGKKSTSKCFKCETITSIMMQNCDHCEKTLCAICWQTHMDELVKQVRQLDVQLNSASEKMDHKMMDYTRNVKIEVINALNRGDSPIGASSSYEMRKTCFLQHGPLNTEDAVFAFYKNHTFKPKLVWNKCHRPAGIGLAPWGNEITEQQLLYVAGTESKVVFVVNRTDGKIVQRICHDEMAYPNGICFDPDREEIFISDKWKHCIFVFSAKGTFLRRLCDKGEQEGYLRSPEGLAVGPNDSLFVCDAGNDRVQCINSITGRMLSQFGRILKDQLLRAIHTKTPTRHVDLKCPTSVAVHKDTVIILDSGNRRVKAFNKRGEQILEFGQTGSLTGQFQYPEVIAVDSAGFTLVGDGGSAKVLVYGPGGQFVTAFGSRGDSPGKFNWLSGLYVSKDREIIISDYKNHSVQIIS